MKDLYLVGDKTMTAKLPNGRVIHMVERKVFDKALQAAKDTMKVRDDLVGHVDTLITDCGSADELANLAASVLKFAKFHNRNGKL